MGDNTNLKIEKLKYDMKKVFNLLFYKPSDVAKETLATVELSEVLGDYLGRIFDFDAGYDFAFSGGHKARAYNLYYNSSINQVIAVSEANDYVKIDFYAGIKLQSTLDLGEAKQFFKQFARELNNLNDDIPVVESENSIYAFLKVYSEEFTKPVLQKDYYRHFTKFVDIANETLTNFMYAFNSDFNLSLFDADTYKLFIRPRNFFTAGRLFDIYKSENLVNEVTALLSEMSFEPSHYLNINNNFIYGKSRIDGKMLKTGVYVLPVENVPNRYEIKIISIFKFVVVANEDELQVSKSYGLGGFNSIQNSANLSKPNKVNIDLEHLDAKLKDIETYIYERSKQLGDVQVLRDSTPKNSSKFRYTFNVVLRDIKNGSNRHYTNNYLQDVKRLFNIITMAVKSVSPYVSKDITISNFDDEFILDPLLKIKRFENYVGAFNSKQVERSLE